MQLFQELQQQGFEVILVDANTIGVKPADKLTPELADRIRTHKPELIEALLRKQRQADQYDKPKYPPKPKDRCYACKSYDWWLSRYGVWTCRICHPPGPGAEVEPEVYQSIAQGQSGDPRGSGKVSRYCRGYQPARYVHPDVCRWHLERADLHCADCKHLSKEDRERWMDAYLNRAIAKLNARGCRYYTPADIAARRERIYELERQITATFLACNVSAFIEAVNEWGKYF